jgi:EAL domain-containing protein (putative c-di-GMP-specific phosphodiesterase class I)
MTKQAFDRTLLRTGLAHAGERGELALFCQPQLALDARRIPGIEALLRWLHPVLGCLAPRALSRACRGDRVDPRDLRTALTQRKRWQSEGLDEGTRIKINLSRKELGCPGFAEDLGSLERELDLDAGLVSLELTETGIVSDSAAALDGVERVQRLGVELSIDHFGAFSSSLADLKRLPIGELKMDKSSATGFRKTSTTPRSHVRSWPWAKPWSCASSPKVSRHKITPIFSAGPAARSQRAFSVPNRSAATI